MGEPPIDAQASIIPNANWVQWLPGERSGEVIYDFSNAGNFFATRRNFNIVRSIGWILVKGCRTVRLLDVAVMLLLLLECKVKVGCCIDGQDSSGYTIRMHLSVPTLVVRSAEKRKAILFEYNRKSSIGRFAFLCGVIGLQLRKGLDMSETRKWRNVHADETILSRTIFSKWAATGFWSFSDQKVLLCSLLIGCKTGEILVDTKLCVIRCLIKFKFHCKAKSAI